MSYTSFDKTSYLKVIKLGNVCVTLHFAVVKQYPGYTLVTLIY